MKQLDNHIDELDEILHDLAEALESLDEEPDSGKWAENGIEYIDEAKRQIEDFYRNKILEARADEINQVMGNLQDNSECVTCYNNHAKLERHYADITAQFNSKGKE